MKPELVKCSHQMIFHIRGERGPLFFGCSRRAIWLIRWSYMKDGRVVHRRAVRCGHHFSPRIDADHHLDTHWEKLDPERVYR